MARVAVSDWTDRSLLPDPWENSAGNLEEAYVGSKRVRLVKAHSQGLAKCSNCGGDVKIHISPKRNPHSGKLGRAVTLKDHDLCRRCWRQIIRTCRETVLANDYHSPDLNNAREVA